MTIAEEQTKYTESVVRRQRALGPWKPQISWLWHQKRSADSFRI